MLPTVTYRYRYYEFTDTYFVTRTSNQIGDSGYEW